MAAKSKITSPDSPVLDELCRELAARTDALDLSGDWPAEQFRLLGAYGVYEWFLPKEWGGQQWSEVDCIRGYLRLSEACLTTTFVLTQRTGACQRIADGDSPRKAELLPPLVSGESFATVGISHLTTSRQHLGRPALAARETGGGFELDGFSPWVTGGTNADAIVTGATLDDGRQILAVVPTDLPGVSADPPARLVGLSASHTGAVHFKNVMIEHDLLLGGPIENVMARGIGGNTGGLQTSTLAIGLARAAIAFLENEAVKREDLGEPTAALARDAARAADDLLALAAGSASCTQQDLRYRANSLALRATQAALTAAKGAGYVAGHPAGRWCREALFFLVWSCPQPVAAAALCDLAGLG
ncbi:MAG TPA: acyl-CoA dehydrogenase family protein [Pirellulales bacterium]|nr:acyl-CoA dehydrogenase family protein [Pirellulales bacterium]